LIDNLRLDSVSLVGQSMGGWTCLEDALREPRRVRASARGDRSRCTRAAQFNQAIGRIV